MSNMAGDFLAMNDGDIPGLLDRGASKAIAHTCTASWNRVSSGLRGELVLVMFMEKQRRLAGEFVSESLRPIHFLTGLGTTSQTKGRHARTRRAIQTVLFFEYRVIL